MKRVNIHLEESTISELDKLAEKLKEKGGYWQRGYLNRADLIRYAIGKTFHIQTGYTGSLETYLTEIFSPTKKARK
jgi:hypothetical protein